MRTLIPNAISKENIGAILSCYPSNCRIEDRWTDEAIKDLVEQIKEHAPILAGGKSYFRVETQAQGHPPHYDGCTQDLQPNHMSWCAYSAVMLLTDPESFKGGEFQFLEPDERHRGDLYGSLLIYSSGAHNDPQLHLSTPHRWGERTMLLMFFEEDPDGTRPKTA